MPSRRKLIKSRPNHMELGAFKPKGSIRRQLADALTLVVAREATISKMDNEMRGLNDCIYVAYGSRKSTPAVEARGLVIRLRREKLELQKENKRLRGHHPRPLPVPDPTATGGWELRARKAEAEVGSLKAAVTAREMCANAEVTARAVAWEDTAARHLRNEQWLKALLVQVGEVLGPDAYRCDDGTSVPSVLVAKVPGLVERRMDELAMLWKERDRMRSQIKRLRARSRK